MKRLIRAAAGLLALAAVGSFPTSTPAYSTFSPTQYYWVLSDGYSISCVYNTADWQVWNTGWYWGDFAYTYYEDYTNQWSRHWLFDFETNDWVYCYTVNYQNYN